MDLFFDKEFRQIIPPLQPDELAQLEASLKSEGNRDPIVIWKEKTLLLDGHNRYDLCHKNNIELKPPIELSFKNRNEAQVWIIRNQFARRNLNKYQRSVLALKLKSIFSANAKRKQAEGGKNKVVQNSAQPSEETKTREELATIADVSHDTISKVEAIEAKATTEQKAKLAEGDATINQVYVAVHRQEVRDQSATMEWPTDKYRVIYADPPWRYSNKNPPDRFVEQSDYYRTYTVEEIITKFPVQDITLDNAVLFLWATSPILEEVFEIIKAWGFKYKSSFVWDKVKHNMGHYNSIRHEFLLIAIKGKCQPDVLKLFDSVVTIERNGRHSEKPDYFREIIDTLYPYGPRIELFGRSKAKGWEVYGNEIAT